MIFINVLKVIVLNVIRSEELYSHRKTQNCAYFFSVAKIVFMRFGGKQRKRRNGNAMRSASFSTAGENRSMRAESPPCRREPSPLTSSIVRAESEKSSRCQKYNVPSLLLSRLFVVGKSKSPHELDVEFVQINRTC